MASSITLKSSSYDGRYMELVCTQTSNGSAKNSSTIKWTLSTKGGSVNHYSTGSTKVVINGVTVYSKDRVKYSAETFPASKGSVSGEVTVGHSADGTKKINVSFSTAIYTSTVSTYSDSWTLDSIPRYGTSKQSLNAKTETTIKMNWSSDSTVDYLWYSKDNGSTWTGVNVTDGTSGTYTISSGISPNTTYKIKTRIRRKDSQLTTDSAVLSVTTYNYPYCTSAPDFVIGNEVTLKFYNPLNRTFDFTIIGNGVTIGTWTGRSGESYKGVSADSTQTKLYNSIPSLKSAKYSVTVTYGTSQKKTDGGYYSVNEKLCVPTFSTFAYADTNTTVTNLIGNAGLIKGLSSLSVAISAANKMVAKNGATPKRYVATIDTLSKEITYSTSDVTKAIGVVTSSGTKRLNVTAYDSRGIPKTAYKDVVVYDYAIPVIKAKITRLNNFESQTTVKVSGTYSRLTINNADKNTIKEVKYRCRETGGTWPTTYTTLTFNVNAGSFSCPDLILNLPNSQSFEFQFVVTDNLKTGSASGTVGVGQAIFFISTNKKTCYMNGKEIALLEDVPTLHKYTNIPDSTDLNTLTTIGTYKSVSKAHTDTMTNTPSGLSGGFRMIVSNWTGDANYNTLVRQELFYYNRQYVRCLQSDGVTWSAWQQVAFLETAHPVGSVYISSTNTNPASTLGIGTWTLIDKSFKEGQSGGANSNFFSPASDNQCYNNGGYVYRGGNTIRIRQSVKSDWAMDDTGMTLGYFNWDEIGVTSIAFGFNELFAHVDGANGGILYSVIWDTGEVKQVDVIGLDTFPSDKNIYLEFTAVVGKDLMLDDFCDRFYWKRTK